MRDDDEPGCSGLTRSQVLTYVVGAFTSGESVPTESIIRHAAERGAPEPVQRFLAHLPGRAYQRPNELWDELPEIPIGE